MGTPTVKGDFDKLERVAASFGGQADQTRRLLQKLKRQIGVLEGGAWVGKGARAFYAEMNDKVTPAVNSLAGALDGAAQNMHKISQVMQQAERDVTSLFAAEAVAGALAGAAAQAAVAAAAGAVAGAAVGAAAGAVAAAVQAATRAAEDAAIDQKLSGFSPGVRDLAKKSPTMRADILALSQRGFTIGTGPIADGSATNAAGKSIVIGQPDSDASTVSGLAHEAGHGLSTLPEGIPATPTMTRAQYVQANVANDMLNEGGAQFNAARVRAELNAAGGPDVGIPGTQTAAYQAVYDNFTSGKITQNQAVQQMGQLMGNERTSTPPKIPYHQYYGNWYGDDWDTNIAPGRSSR